MRQLPLFGAQDDPAARGAELERLREEVERTACEGAARAVFSSGAVAAALMIVGEAPAEADERTRQPFSGPAGRLLRTALGRAGIPLDACYLTNVVKCRAVRLEGGATRTRPPTRREVARWAPVLDHEIDLVHPRLILALGAVAATRLLGQRARLSDRRGQVAPTAYGVPCLATVHPAYLLRLDGAVREQQEALYTADMETVRETLGA